MGLQEGSEVQGGASEGQLQEEDEDPDGHQELFQHFDEEEQHEVQGKQQVPDYLLQGKP